MSEADKNPKSTHRDTIIVFAVVIAMLLSIISLVAAYRANRTSAYLARPYVALEVVPIGGKYLNAVKQNEECVISYALKLTNQGQTPAVKLLFPDHANVGRDAKGRSSVSPFKDAPLPMALASGESHEGVMGLVVPLKGNDPMLYDKVLSGEISFVIELVIGYQGILDTDTSYYTGLACELSAHKLQMIGTSFK